MSTVNNQELIKFFLDTSCVFQERTFIVAAIIGIAVIISVISLLSLPLNTENNEWWSYDSMRDKIIQSDADNVIELEEGMKFQSDKDGS